MSISFKDVPVGFKWVIAVAVGPEELPPSIQRRSYIGFSKVLGMSAKGAVVRDNMVTTVTLNLSITQRVLDISEKVSGATTIADFGTPAPIEVLRSNQTAAFHSNNFAPPKVQPVTTLWHGYKTANGDVFRFDPPVPYIADEPNRFQPGQKLVTSTTLKKVGDPPFSQLQTATIEFVGWQGAFRIPTYPSPPHRKDGAVLVPNAAYRTVKVSGGPAANQLQWVEWLMKGFGSVLRLDIDPTQLIGEGTVPTRIWMARQPADFYPPYMPPIGFFFPLDITHERVYIVSPGTGAGSIDVSVDLPFGLVACNADPKQVIVRYSLPVDTTNAPNSALNIANYTFTVKGVELDKSKAVATALDPQTIEIDNLPGLEAEKTLVVKVVNVRTKDGAKTIPDDGISNVVETKIRTKKIAIALCPAGDSGFVEISFRFWYPNNYQYYEPVNLDPATAVNKANYTLESPLGVIKDLTPATVFLTDPDRVRIEGIDLRKGDLFRVIVRNLRTVEGFPLLEDGVHNVYKGTVRDTTPPRITVARFFTTAPHVELEFSEPLDLREAQIRWNYSFRHVGGPDYDWFDVEVATYDGTTVRLTVGPGAPKTGNVYRVRASVRDLVDNYGESEAEGEPRVR